MVGCSDKFYSLIYLLFSTTIWSLSRIYIFNFFFQLFAMNIFLWNVSFFITFYSGSSLRTFSFAFTSTQCAFRLVKIPHQKKSTASQNFNDSIVKRTLIFTATQNRTYLFHTFKFMSNELIQFAHDLRTFHKCYQKFDIEYFQWAKIDCFWHILL